MSDAPTVAGPPRARPLVVALAVAATLASLVPVFVPALHRADPLPGPLQAICTLLALATPVAAVLACWRWMPLDVDPRQKAGLFALLVALTLLQTHLHLSMVDQAPHQFTTGASFTDNTHWQRVIHEEAALRGNPHPYFTPHNLRFLPNGYTQWLHQATGSFVAARTLYRLTFGFLLVLSIYSLGRVWLSHRAAVVGVLFYALIYPVSIRYYAGQLTDPMSHLSIVLGLRFLVRGPFAYFALCVLVGSLAKESVLALVPAYAVVWRRDRGQLARAAALFAAAIGVAWVVRLLVLEGRQGTPGALTDLPLLDHLKRNLGDQPWTVWIPQTALTLGPTAPFLVLAWRRCPVDLRGLAVYMTLVLLATNLRYSWLREARNLVPAAVLLGIVAAGWLLDEWRDAERPADPPPATRT